MLDYPNHNVPHPPVQMQVSVVSVMSKKAEKTQEYDREGGEKSERDR